MVEQKPRQTPPYLSYVTFKNTIQNLALDGRLPRQIDRTILETMSGAGQKQFIAALKFFDLIDGNGAPQENLVRLAKATEDDWKDFMGVLLRERFAREVEQLEDASPKTLRESFVGSFEGIGSSLIEPGIRFLVVAARDCGLPVSGHLSKRRAGASNPPRRKPKRVARQGVLPEETKASSSLEGDSVQTVLLNKFPEFDPTWPEQQQQAWFTAYQRLLDLHAGSGSGSSQSDNQEEKP